MLRPFRLVTPGSLAEATAELHRLGDRARLYAGGAELILLMRQGLLEVDYLVDIKNVPGLAEVGWDGQVVRIGATTTHRRIERDPLVRAELPALISAESHVGNVRIRSQGTLGGNLCFADPHADPGTALLIYDASVVLEGPNGRRRLPLDDFFVGTYETALEPAELLAQVEAPPLPTGWGAAFLRIERFYRPTLNVAVAARVADGRVGDVRLAVGCVGPRALRLSELEAQVRGLPLDQGLRQVAAAGQYLEERLEPVDGLLGSRAYKLHITKVLLGRALQQAADASSAA